MMLFCKIAKMCNNGGFKSNDQSHVSLTAQWDTPRLENNGWAVWWRILGPKGFECGSRDTSLLPPHLSPFCTVQCQGNAFCCGFIVFLLCFLSLQSYHLTSHDIFTGLALVCIQGNSSNNTEEKAHFEIPCPQCSSTKPSYLDFLLISLLRSILSGSNQLKY